MHVELPPTAQVLAEVIGAEQTIRLARRAKNRSIYIPKKLTPWHWLRAVLGDDDAEKLSAEFPGMCLPLAKCHSVIVAERNRRIADSRAQGLSCRQIAERIGLPKNTVQTIAYRMCEKDKKRGDSHGNHSYGCLEV